MTATLTQLLHRRAVLGVVSRRRRRSVRVPSARAPASAVMTYAHLARGVLAALDEALVVELREVGLVHLDAGADGSSRTLPSSIVDRIVGRLERVLRGALDSRGLVAGLDTIAARTSSHSREEFQRQVKAALGIDLPAGEPNLAPKIADFRRANTDLIRSLAREKVERVRSILTDAGSGTRVETIAKRIREETDATPQRAALIARDQVLKLNAEVTQARHEAAGLDSYIWRTSRDERVRKEHKALEGKRFRYDDPPVVSPRGDRANPGEWFQCRCVAEPFIEGLDDL